MRPIRCSTSIGFQGRSKLNRMRAELQVDPLAPGCGADQDPRTIGPLEPLLGRELVPWSPPLQHDDTLPGIGGFDLARAEQLDRAR